MWDEFHFKLHQATLGLLPINGERGQLCILPTHYWDCCLYIGVYTLGTGAYVGTVVVYDFET